MAHRVNRMSHHTFPWRDAFLAALRSMPVVQHACDAVGIERCTAYRARKADESFAEAWEEALEAGIDRAEQEAFRRGVVGFEEPVVYQGQLTPVWARDANGDLIREEYEVSPAVGDKPAVMGTRPVQAKDANGQPQWLTVRKHSDAMLALVLKARRKTYGTERTELTSPDGSMSPVDESSRAARVAQLLAAARARQEGAAVPQDDDFNDLA
jgi:hypothetical protein